MFDEEENVFLKLRCFFDENILRGKKTVVFLILENVKLNKSSKFPAEHCQL